MSSESEELKSVKGDIKSMNDLLVAVDTKLGILIEDFKSHKIDDDGHFGRIYESINKVPDRLNNCKESLKTEIMNISRKEFAQVTDFKVFRAEVKTSVRTGVIIGSLVGSTIMGAIMLILKLTGMI